MWLRYLMLFSLPFNCATTTALASMDKAVISSATSQEDIFDFSKIEDDSSAAADDSQYIKYTTKASLIALNKITAKSEEIILEVGQPKYFGNISIVLLNKCRKNINPYHPDDQMYILVSEHKIDDDPLLIFQGWIVSQSASLSTFENPVYDLFAKKCIE